MCGTESAESVRQLRSGAASEPDSSSDSDSDPANEYHSAGSIVVLPSGPGQIQPADGLAARQSDETNLYESDADEANEPRSRTPDLEPNRGPNASETVIRRDVDCNRHVTEKPSGTDDATDGRSEHRECEVCGERVPAATYHEHLLKECRGR